MPLSNGYFPINEVSSIIQADWPVWTQQSVRLHPDLKTVDVCHRVCFTTAKRLYWLSSSKLSCFTSCKKLCTLTDQKLASRGNRWRHWCYLFCLVQWPSQPGFTISSTLSSIAVVCEHIHFPCCLPVKLTLACALWCMERICVPNWSCLFAV